MQDACRWVRDVLVSFVLLAKLIGRHLDNDFERQPKDVLGQWKTGKST